MKPNILIVGGSGFVGTNILKKINHSKYNVFATRNKSKKYLKNNKIKYFKGNLKNLKFCEKITDSIDIVIMCAAVSSGAMVIQNNPMFHVDDNIIMNQNILKASAKNKVKKFIFLSSNTVYPIGKKPMREKDMSYDLFHKYFNVGWMKIFSEKLCEMYKDKMIINIIRPANLYGPYDKFDPTRSKVIPALIRKFERQNTIEVWGSGKDVKDFLFIEDFVVNLLKVLEKINKFSILNICSSNSISLHKILNILKKIHKPKIKKIIFNKTKPSMIPFRKISNNKIKNLIKFKLFNSLEEGIVKTVEWYKKNK
jgi:GDP-L-fucose synthase